MAAPWADLISAASAPLERPSLKTAYWVTTRRAAAAGISSQWRIPWRRSRWWQERSRPNPQHDSPPVLQYLQDLRPAAGCAQRRARLVHAAGRERRRAGADPASLQ